LRHDTGEHRLECVDLAGTRQPVSHTVVVLLPARPTEPALPPWTRRIGRVSQRL